MMRWTVTCLDCDEPVGKPYWAKGCACEEKLGPAQQALLDVLNNAWDSIEWEGSREHGMKNW